MADVTVMWDAPASNMPPGSPAEDHYIVMLGPLSASEPVGTLTHTFLGVAPGDYVPSV